LLGELWDGRSARAVAEEFVASLIEAGADVKAAVVIGSGARGGWRPHSDIDLVLVLGSRRDIRPVLEAPGLGTVDPKPYTVREAIDALEKADTTIIEAMEFGVVIHDDGFWSKLRKLYEEGVRGKVRVRRRNGALEFSLAG